MFSSQLPVEELDSPLLESIVNFTEARLHATIRRESRVQVLQALTQKRQVRPAAQVLWPCQGDAVYSCLNTGLSGGVSPGNCDGPMHLPRCVPFWFSAWSRGRLSTRHKPHQSKTQVRPQHCRRGRPLLQSRCHLRRRATLLSIVVMAAIAMGHLTRFLLRLLTSSNV